MQKACIRCGFLEKISHTCSDARRRREELELQCQSVKNLCFC